jgi:hypothetical protein
MRWLSGTTDEPLTLPLVILVGWRTSAGSLPVGASTGERRSFRVCPEGRSRISQSRFPDSDDLCTVSPQYRSRPHDAPAVPQSESHSKRPPGTRRRNCWSRFQRRSAPYGRQSPFLCGTKSRLPRNHVVNQWESNERGLKTECG